MATPLHYGTLSSFRFADEAGDVRGTTLFGRGDEKLGTIDDVIFEHSTGNIRYAVIDTGGWLRHRRFIVPANQIRAYEKHDDHFYADLTKAQVEKFPPYKSEALKMENEWDKYEQQYEKSWQDEGNVMHRADSDHILTPTPDEMPASSAGANAATGLTSAVEGHTPDIWPKRIQSPTPFDGAGSVNFAPDDATPTTNASERASFADRRWQKFEENVTRNLDKIQQDCPTCGKNAPPQFHEATQKTPQKKAS